MASILRVLLVLLAILGALDARATCPSGQVSSTGYAVQGYGLPPQGSVMSAVEYYYVNKANTAFEQNHVVSCNGNTCVSHYTNQNGVAKDTTQTWSIVVSEVCNAAPPPACPARGDGYVPGQYIYDWNGKGDGVLTACKNGCEVESAGQTYSGMSGTKGYTLWSGQVSTGKGCTSDPTVKDSPLPTVVTGPSTPTTVPPVPAQPAVDPPPPGKCDGVVNGVSVRVDCDRSNTNNDGKPPSPASPTAADNGSNGTPTTTGDTQRKTTNTSCAAGACTTTTTVTTTHADGSTDTVSTKTTIDSSGGGGSSQTTKTGTNADGSAKTPSTGAAEDGTNDDTCKAHPDAAGCKKTTSSANAGDCPTPATCDGDAIMCAQLQEQHKSRCAVQKDSDAMRDADATKLGQAIASGNDPDGSSLPTKDQTGKSVDLSFDPANVSGVVGGPGHCFSSFSVPIPMGQSIAVDMSTVCDKLGPMRYVALILAALSSTAILFRGLPSMGA